MIYMNEMVAEALWKWPPQPTSDRACVKYYSLDNARLENEHR